MPARLLPSQALAQRRLRDARDSQSLSHTGSPDRRKWETKPNVENPSSVAPREWRPRPPSICAWTAALRGCGAAGQNATSTHTHPRPPGAVPCHPAHPQLGCKPLRAMLGRAPHHRASSRSTLSGGPGCFRQATPTVPSCPRFSPLLVPIPKRKVLPSSLRAPSARVRPAGAAPRPRTRAAINRRLPARRGARRGARGCSGAAWEA